MAITQTITVLPTPPSRADPANFDPRADAFLSALPTMQTQMNTWAGQANSTASAATGAAGGAEAAQAAAEAAQGTATTQAGIATTQAGIATTQAGTATTQAGIATTQAGTATTQAGIATTQAGIATTKAGEAAASAALAEDIASGGLVSVTPAANKIPQADGDGEIALGWLDLTGYAQASHAHGNITAAGAIGSTANLPVITTTSGALTVGAFGTGATNFTVGNDARLSDARTPTAHKTSHATGGSDALTAADIGAATSGHDHALTYQPLDTELTALAGLAVTDGNFAVGNGSTWVAESGATARTSLGLGTAATKDVGTGATEVAAGDRGVTNGNSHDHNGGDGAAITEAAITLADNTTNNASTTRHGFEPKATAPASGLRSVLAIDNGETARTDKALFDATNPATLGGTAAPGTAMTAARRDHVHALPSLGKILQVAASSSPGEVAVSSGTYTSLGLSVTLTPRDTNSKILLIANTFVYVTVASGDVGADSRLLRGATVLWEKPAAPWTPYEGLTGDITYVYQDSPATASAVTYSLEGRVWNYTAGETAYFKVGSIVALEVAG